MSRKYTIRLKVDRHRLPGSGEHGATEETAVGLFLFSKHGGLRLAAVCAVVAVAAALDSILTAFAPAPASV